MPQHGACRCTRTKNHSCTRAYTWPTNTSRQPRAQKATWRQRAQAQPSPAKHVYLNPTDRMQWGTTRFLLLDMEQWGDQLGTLVTLFRTSRRRRRPPSRRSAKALARAERRARARVGFPTHSDLQSTPTLSYARRTRAPIAASPHADGTRPFNPEVGGPGASAVGTRGWQG